MPFEEGEKIAFVEATLNGLLTLGVSPPKNASMFVSLFDGQVTKEELMSFFVHGRIKWVMGFGSKFESYDDYKSSMSQAAIRVLENANAS